MYTWGSLRITVLRGTAPVATAMQLLLPWLLLPSGCSRGSCSLAAVPVDHAPLRLLPCIMLPCGCSRGSCSLAAAPEVAIHPQEDSGGASMLLDGVTIPTYDRAPLSPVPLPRRHQGPVFPTAENAAAISHNSFNKEDLNKILIFN